MVKAPAFQFYYKEWLTGTKGMSRTERDIYLNLLIFQFDSDGKLPTDEDELCRIVEAKGKKEIESLRYVLKKKFTVVENYFSNKKMRDILTESRAYRLKQQQNGMKGGRQRNPPLSSGFPNNNPSPSPTPTSTSTPEVSNKEYQSITPISQAMIESVFLESKFSSSEGADFYKYVEGRHGWKNINNPLAYTMAAIAQRLKSKNVKQNQETW